MTLDLGVKVTQNVVQYPLHHLTYTAVKFDVATPNSLGRENTSFDLDLGAHQGHTKSCPVPSTSCDLFSYKV